MTSHPNTILVASADDALRATLADSLHESGYRVCNSAESAEHDPDVIVLDTALPRGERSSLLSRTRRRAPIVALAPRDDVRQTAAEDGVWVCLAKPVEVANLVLALDRITTFDAPAAA